jgi:sec-independent protein translocase protein TatA
MGNLGATEIILILVVLVLIFGGRKIPELMRGIGNGVQEFKKAASSNSQPQKTPSPSSRYRSIPYNYFLESSLLGRDLLLQDSSFAKKQGTNFEAMLFTSAYIMRRIKQIKPDLYIEFEEGYINEIYNYTHKQNIIEFLPDGFKNFFAQRFKINSQEIELLQKPQEIGFVPLQSVVYNLYDKPLTKNGSYSHNLPASLELTVKIPNVFNFLNKAIDSIIEEKKL